MPTEFISLRARYSGGVSEHGTELSRFIKGGELHRRLSDYQFLKKARVP
jgi:hypothetical protein